MAKKRIDIINCLYKYLTKRVNGSYENTDFEMSFGINNFIKYNRNYDHLQYIKEIPEKHEEYKTDYPYMDNNNLILKIPYQDDKYCDNDADGMSTKAKAERRKREKLLSRITKTAMNNITNSPENQQKPKKKLTIGKPVKLTVNLDGNTIENGSLYQLGLMVANKNVYKMSQVKKCLENLKEDIYEDIINDQKKLVDLKPISEIPNNNGNSGFSVNLHTNSTLIKHGFWVYFLILIKENDDIRFSDGFSLISYRQLNKRQEEEKKEKTQKKKEIKKKTNPKQKQHEKENKSFLEKQRKLMENKEESLYPYFFKSLFYFDGEDGKYKMKNIFDFCIKFHKESNPIQINDGMQPALDARNNDVEPPSPLLLPTPSLSNSSIEGTPSPFNDSIIVYPSPSPSSSSSSMEESPSNDNIEKIPSPSSSSDSMEESPYPSSTSGNMEEIPSPSPSPSPSYGSIKVYPSTSPSSDSMEETSCSSSFSDSMEESPCPCPSSSSGYMEECSSSFPSSEESLYPCPSSSSSYMEEYSSSFPSTFSSSGIKECLFPSLSSEKRNSMEYINNSINAQQGENTQIKNQFLINDPIITRILINAQRDNTQILNQLLTNAQRKNTERINQLLIKSQSENVDNKLFIINYLENEKKSIMKYINNSIDVQQRENAQIINKILINAQKDTAQKINQNFINVQKDKAQRINHELINSQREHAQRIYQIFINDKGENGQMIDQFFINTLRENGQIIDQFFINAQVENDQIINNFFINAQEENDQIINQFFINAQGENDQKEYAQKENNQKENAQGENDQRINQFLINGQNINSLNY